MVLVKFIEFFQLQLFFQQQFKFPLFFLQRAGGRRLSMSLFL